MVHAANREFVVHRREWGCDADGRGHQVVAREMAIALHKRHVQCVEVYSGELALRCQQFEWFSRVVSKMGAV